MSFTEHLEALLCLHPAYFPADFDVFREPGADEDPNLFDWRRPPFLRWVETYPECGQALGHFHLPDGRALTTGG